MTNREQATMTRNAGLNKFLADNAPVYAGDLAFSTLKTNFDTDYAKLLGSASAANPDNAGFSQEKLNAKNAASESAATLCGLAQVKLEMLGKYSVSVALHDSESYYSRAADAVAAARLQGVHDLMVANIADLTPNYVTTGDLTSLETLINTFTGTQGSSQEVHAVSPTLTDAFKADLKTVSTDVKNFLKLGKKYKTSNSTFYNGLVAICEVPAVNIHHTTLHITTLDKETGTPIPGVLGTVSNTSKTGTTGSTGFFEIDSIPSGNPTLSLKATGYPDYSSLVHIISGAENDFTILLQKA